MENKLPIWQTTKQSFTFVYYHFMNWMRLASAPFAIMLLAGILVLVMGGTAAYVVDGNEQAVAGMEMEAMGAGLGVLLVVFIANLVAFLMFAVNAYRYVMYNEGGEKWFEFRFDHYMWRLFLYTLLVFLIFAAAGGVVGGITAGVAMMDISSLTVAVGVVLGLIMLYYVVRFFFVLPLVALGIEKPIHESMSLTKGRVLRLLGLIILVAILAGLAALVIMFVGGFAFGLMSASDIAVLQGVGMAALLVLQTLTNLFTQAVTMTALILAYKHIAGK